MDFLLLIFTDLDGTLLDQRTYSCKDAEETLQRLHQLAIPLVLTSSKTCAEILDLQAGLGLHEAFISENGGGIFVPAGHPLADNRHLQPLGDIHGIPFGKPYAYVRNIFTMFQDAYDLKGFGDMAIEELMQLTGLSMKQARLAAKRDFSEPFLFKSAIRPDELKTEVARHGLTVIKGGRFYHLMSKEQDKGRAVSKTIRLFQDIRQENIVSIGLGDDENDFSMLKVVDIPVLVPKPDGKYASLDLAGIRKAPWPGSRGWGAAVTSILDEYQLPGSRH